MTGRSWLAERVPVPRGVAIIWCAVAVLVAVYWLLTGMLWSAERLG